MSQTLQQALKDLTILEDRVTGSQMLLSYLQDIVYNHFENRTDKELKSSFDVIEKDLKQFILVAEQQIKSIRTAKVQINEPKKSKARAKKN